MAPRGALLAAAAVGAGAAPPEGCAVFEKDWDLQGGDYSVSPTNDNDCVADGNCPCQKQCDDDAKCHSWTLVPGKKCCLKGGVPTPRKKPGSGFFSGVKAKYVGDCGKPAPPPSPRPTPPPYPPAPPHTGPLACQDNEWQPMLPTYHIIGNVSVNADGSIKMENINDCSGVTYYKGIYHVWHQCCQNHWDHVISKDLIHWQRLPPPIQPLNLKTWDGSIAMLDAEDGGPVMLYDAQDGRKSSDGGLDAPFDSPILGVARPDDVNDKYLKTWTRDSSNPAKQVGGKPISFPGPIWRNGDHYNFIGQGARFTTKDKSFMSWTRVAPDMIGHGENGGQWWMPTPNQVGGKPPPPGTPDYLVNVGGGDRYLIGNYHPGNESFTHDNTMLSLQHGKAGWWGASGGKDNNDRMMMIGWVSDWHGPAGPGINFLTRLTLLEEVNWDVKTQSLVVNPLPELVGLRTGKLASEKAVALTPNAPHAVAKTSAGAAASSDIVIKFSGFGSTPVVFGACVLGNSSGSGVGITVSVNPGANGTHVANAQAGACSTTTKPAGGGSVQLFDESELTVRILADRSVADFFVQGGRWAATEGWPFPEPREAAASQVTVWAGTDGVRADIDVYAMGCGWADPSYTENPVL